jgi:transcriptional regulator with PAS, ATPase and Fis domain
MDREIFQKKYGIIGRSGEILEIIHVIRQVAPTDITVLITGESGTGKEMVAKAIHGESRRAERNMVSVNCGAIPEGLMESELFGHEKGAFTSAGEMRRGYFEIADGGTIFLDEIGEMPLATQVKLLRVLENGEFMRIGSSAARKTDVRVIAATNKILDYEVQQKNFRPDLYFRLRSINIHLPPLRSRKEDIPLLVENFIKEAAGRNKIDFKGFTDSATDLFMNYSWPGNIRQLKNVVESMVTLEGDKLINEDDVRKYLFRETETGADRNLPVISNKTVEQAERELIYRALVDLKSNIIEMKDLLSDRIIGTDESGGTHTQPRNGNGVLTMDEMERRMISTALNRNKGNRRLAARELNISERTLYRKIKDYGLQ